MAPASALETLRHSLGSDRAALLKFLPFDKVKFEGQHEIPSAVSTSILFGSHKIDVSAEVKPLTWIYLSRKSLTLYFHCYYPNGELCGLYMIDDVSPTHVRIVMKCY